MKGKKIIGNGVTGVTIEFSMNELIVINDLCENIIRDISHEHGDDETATTTLVKIICRIPQELFDLHKTYVSLKNDNIFEPEGSKVIGKINLEE